MFQVKRTEVKVTVIGDCGGIHNSLKEWQDCDLCGSLGKAKRAGHYSPTWRDWPANFGEGEAS